MLTALQIVLPAYGNEYDSDILVMSALAFTSDNVSAHSSPRKVARAQGCGLVRQRLGQGMTSILRFSGASRPQSPLTLVACLTTRMTAVDRDDEQDLVAAKHGETGIRKAASRDDWQGAKIEQEKTIDSFVSGDSSGGTENLEGPVRGVWGDGDDQGPCGRR